MAKSTIVKDTSSAVATPEQDSVKDRVLQDYKNYFAYVNSTYWERWRKYWKLWNNQRVRRQYDGDNDSFEPMTFQMVETIVDNIYGSRPKLAFMPTQPEQECDTKLLNAMWDYNWDRANMDDLLPPWGREITVTGNGVLFCSWEDGFMKVEHVPVRDCIFDVAATSPGDWRFVGYRRLAMLDELKAAKRFDPTAGGKDENGQSNGAWVPRYSNLGQIKGTRGGPELTDKELKDQIYQGSTLSGNAQKDQVELLYMHYKDKVVEVANRDTVIFDGPNEYFKPATKVTVQVKDDDGDKLYDENTVPEEVVVLPEADMRKELEKKLKPITMEIEAPAIEPFIPVVLQRGYIDRALLLAKGDVEPFMDAQEDLNDSVNVKRDNITYSVQNVGIIDYGSKDAIPDLSQAKPGSIIPIKNLSQFGQNTFRWLEKPNYAAAADLEIQRAKGVIRDTARVSELAQGLVPQGVRTAMEIQALMAQASAGFAKKIKSLESGAYKQLGDIYVKMIQIFLTEEQMVRVVGSDGVEFKSFDPTKFWGQYNVKVMLEDEIKASQKQDADNVINAYKTFAGDPDFNQVELKKLVARKAFDMDDDELELLLNPNPGNQAVDQNGQPVGDMAAGTPAPMGQLPPPSGPPVAPPAQPPAFMRPQGG